MPLSLGRAHLSPESSFVGLPEELVVALAGQGEEVEVGHDSSRSDRGWDQLRVFGWRAPNISQMAGIAAPGSQPDQPGLPRMKRPALAPAVWSTRRGIHAGSAVPSPR